MSLTWAARRLSVRLPRRALKFVYGIRMRWTRLQCSDGSRRPTSGLRWRLDRRHHRRGVDVGAPDAGSDATPCDAAIGSLRQRLRLRRCWGVLCLDTDAGLCAASAQACSIEQGRRFSVRTPPTVLAALLLYQRSVYAVVPLAAVTLSARAAMPRAAEERSRFCQVNGDCFMGTCHPVASPFATFGVCE